MSSQVASKRQLTRRNWPDGWEWQKFWKDSKHWVHEVLNPDKDPDYEAPPDWVIERRKLAGIVVPDEVKSPIEYNPVIRSDSANAELFSELHNERVRFDHRRNRWLIWKGSRWEPDSNGEVYRLAVQTAKYRYKQAEGISDLEERKRETNWAISSESRAKIDACIALAKNIQPIADTGNTWDASRWLLGTENGVIDLKTGELRPGKPDDRITMSAGIEYNPEADCPRWKQFLSEVFDDDDLTNWIWRALGYSLTGDTSEQCVFIGYGKGANGKTRLIEALRHALGDYAYTSPFSTFELHQRSSIPNDMAALENKRFVSSSETNDNTRLNEARIKALSGGDPITARYLHCEYFTFEPHLKIWLLVNHKPKVADDSHGFWRRVKLIPFTKQFTGNQEDKHLGDKLKAEAPGILNWLVKGCLEWQKVGLTPEPECIKNAVKEYKAESDPLNDFIEECCIEKENGIARARELFNAYENWAESYGMKDRERLNSTQFGRKIAQKFEKARDSESKFYWGITLK
jgi:putative DNA primase/helicase